MSVTLILFTVRQYVIYHAFMVKCHSLVNFGVIDFAGFQEILHGFVIGNGGAAAQSGAFNRRNGAGELDVFSTSQPFNKPKINAP